MCPVGLSPSGAFLSEGSFPDSYGVVVFGWDSVVVEGWSACFLVGCVVVFFVKIVDFGELVLSVFEAPLEHFQFLAL